MEAEVVMSGPKPPYDEDAERDLLGSILLTREALFAAVEAGVAVDDFYVPTHQATYAAMLDLHAEGLPSDITTVAAASKNKQVTREWLHRVQARTPVSMNAPGYARIVAERAYARRVIALGETMRNAGYTANVDDLRALADTALESLTAPLERAVGEELDDGLEDETVMDDKPWVIPGLMRLMERMVLTGSEGGGKSTWTRQVSVCCASGIHPFTGISTNMPRSRVLIVDLQEDRADVIEALRPLRENAGTAYERGWLKFKARPQGMNLLERTDQRWLEALIVDHEPHLLVIGPIRKLFRAGKYAKSSEEAVDELTRIIDDLRVQYRFSIILEGHAGHDRDDWRMRGSSVWYDWPEFGHGLADQSDDSTRACQLHRWRIDRHSDRPWPHQYFQGHRWPWEPSAGTQEKLLEVSGLGWMTDRGQAQELDGVAS